MVERSPGHAEPARIATDLIQRQEAEIAIEGGVFQGLCHDRPGDLLELHRGAQYIGRLPVSGQIGGQDAVNEIEDGRLTGPPARSCQADRPVDIAAVVRTAAARGDVGAVDREGRDHLFERA